MKKEAKTEREYKKSSLKDDLEKERMAQNLK